MEPTIVVILMLVALIAMVIGGIHIALALGVTSIVGVTMMFGDLQIGLAQSGQASFDVIRNFLFAVVPLFVLMGEFVSKCGAAGDLYKVMNHTFGRLPGRLAVATVAGNAVFAAVTGTSLASAAAFSRIAYPEMIAAGYDRRYALGSIAGSACLGMLIPPSVLLIIWGLVTEISIGGLFIAGLLPGLLLALMMAVYSSVAVVINPELAPSVDPDAADALTLQEYISGGGVVALIILVLGGLYGGLTTPTESASIGAIGALLLAIIKGLRWPEIRDAIIDSGKIITPIMFLLITAQMYSQLLALGDITNLIIGALGQAGENPFLVGLIMVIIWLVLGTLLDSASIILLTVPIFWPVALNLGYNEFSFAIMGILTIEAGLLTPPVGLLVYAVKSTVPDATVQLKEIFAGSIPYWILMLGALGVVWLFPDISTWPITWLLGTPITHTVGISFF